ncbi:hypothetical protein ScPMuIL_010683 [Solemya velum]
MENVSDIHEDTGFIVYYYGFYLLMFLVNFIGNIIVICTVLQHKRLRQPKNYFFVSLAISDLLVGLCYPIYSLGHLPILYGTLGQWPVCMVVLPFLIVTMTSSSFHLVAITVTRYIYIVKHYKQYELVTHRRMLVGIAITWVLAIVITLPMYIVEQPGNYSNICRFELVYSPSHTWTFFSVQFVVPMTIMVALYLRIIYAVKTRTIDSMRRTANNSTAFVMVTMLLGWFTISYIPLSIYLIIAVKVQNINKYVRATVRLLTYTNYLINVFIYAGRLKDFRKCLYGDIKKIGLVSSLRGPSPKQDPDSSREMDT